MNPDQNSHQQLNDLPLPQSEGIASSGLENINSGGNKVEQASKASELPQSGGGSTTTPVTSTSSPIQNLSQLNAQPILQPASSHSQSSPSVADDNDLIEKEWVNRAKAIVERTKSDPNLQNKELNHFKADYIKKRYNKDIKVAES